MAGFRNWRFTQGYPKRAHWLSDQAGGGAVESRRNLVATGQQLVGGTSSRGRGRGTSASSFRLASGQPWRWDAVPVLHWAGARVPPKAGEATSDGRSAAVCPASGSRGAPGPTAAVD